MYRMSSKSTFLDPDKISSQFDLSPSKPEEYPRKIRKMDQGPAYLEKSNSNLIHTWWPKLTPSLPGSGSQIDLFQKIVLMVRFT